MHISRLILFDADDLKAINNLLIQLSARAKPCSRAKLAQVLGKSEIYVGRDGCDRIIGMATLGIVNKLMGDEGHVEDVVVDQTHRGKNYGEALMLRLIDRARQLELVHISLTSHPKRVAANNLYAKLGFVIRDTNLRRLELV